MNSEKKKLNRLRDKECSGKKAHATLIGAEYVLNSIKLKAGEILHIYKCTFYKKYHIGHATGTKPKTKQPL